MRGRGGPELGRPVTSALDVLRSGAPIRPKHLVLLGFLWVGRGRPEGNSDRTRPISGPTRQSSRSAASIGSPASREEALEASHPWWLRRRPGRQGSRCGRPTASRDCPRRPSIGWTGRRASRGALTRPMTRGSARPMSRIDPHEAEEPQTFSTSPMVRSRALASRRGR
jgi:hypothetical protein